MVASGGSDGVVARVDVRGRPLSAAALARYRGCPKRFRLQDLGGRRPKQAPSPLLARALAVHHALERFYGLPLEHRQPENLERALRAVWPQHRAGAFRSVEDEIEHGAAALEMLRLYGEHFDLESLPLLREQWLRVEVAGVELYGKVDRVDPLRGGGVEVIDYKTGRRPLEPADLKHEAATQLYVTAAAASLGEEVRRVRFIYLPLALDVAWEIEQEDALWLREQLEQTLSRIELDERFQAQPGRHCDWCPYRLCCVERTQVSLDQIVPVEGLPFDQPPDEHDLTLVADKPPARESSL